MLWGSTMCEPISCNHERSECQPGRAQPSKDDCARQSPKRQMEAPSSDVDYVVGCSVGGPLSLRNRRREFRARSRSHAGSKDQGNECEVSGHYRHAWSAVISSDSSYSESEEHFPGIEGDLGRLFSIVARGCCFAIRVCRLRDSRPG